MESQAINRELDDESDLNHEGMDFQDSVNYPELDNLGPGMKSIRIPSKGISMPIDPVN